MMTVVEESLWETSFSITAVSTLAIEQTDHFLSFFFFLSLSLICLVTGL